MTGWGAETVAVVALALCLFAAIRRPWSLSESAIGIPAALVVVALGVVSPHTAGHTVRDLVPTVCFLAAILVFGHLCANVGIFDYLAGQAAQFSRGDPVRLLTAVVVLAGTVTAFLTLDATVVLLTPVVIVTVRQLRLSSQPYAYACVQLANAGSLLLPVSNLTNLLAFTAAGISFGKFAALMALPWLAIVILQWISLRVFFRTDLQTKADHQVTRPPAPVFGLVVLGLTLAAVVVCSALDIAPAWAAAGGALALVWLPLRQRKTTPKEIITSANLGFCLFVFAIAIVVDGVTAHGVGHVLKHLSPTGSDLWSLLAMTAIAAVLANLVNNIPATVALLPLVSGHPAAVLAMLIGVNVGPNATYAGSLATLLWRRLLGRDNAPKASQFHRYGLVTVVPMMAVSVVLLWLGVEILGV